MKSRFATVLALSFTGITSLLLAACGAPETRASADPSMSVEEARTLVEQGKALETIPRSAWEQMLSSQQYHILWEKGTERAFTGELLDNKKEGVYVTAGCRLPVFSSSTKFESGTGWPSFWDVFDKGNVVLKPDNSWGMKRTEVLSACGEHLGHVFEDGPEPTGLRYCINSLALDFVPAEEFTQKFPGY